MGPQDGVDKLLRSIRFIVRDLKRTDIGFVLMGDGEQQEGELGAKELPAPEHGGQDAVEERATGPVSGGQLARRSDDSASASSTSPAQPRRMPITFQPSRNARMVPLTPEASRAGAPRAQAGRARPATSPRRPATSSMAGGTISCTNTCRRCVAATASRSTCSLRPRGCSRPSRLEIPTQRVERGERHQYGDGCGDDHPPLPRNRHGEPGRGVCPSVSGWTSWFP